MNSNNIYYVRESEWNTNKEIKTFTNLNSQHVVLMNKIIKFYKNKDNLNKLISIISGESYLSLRVIDFFVTNYAREREIIYKIPKNDSDKTENFMVYYSYKSQLKAYSKKRFDPFCRRERILFFIDKFNGINNEPIRTTVGQLNFFRWAITNNLFDYIDKNYDSIESDMNKLTQKTKKTKTIKNKTNNENCEKNSFVMSSKNSNSDLILSATKKINKHNITITVKFN
jgi:hypothetical protein